MYQTKRTLRWSSISVAHGISCDTLDLKKEVSNLLPNECHYKLLPSGSVAQSVDSLETLFSGTTVVECCGLHGIDY